MKWVSYFVDARFRLGLVWGVSMGLVGFTVKEFDVSSQWAWKKGVRESEGFEMAMASSGAYFD